MNFLVDIKMKFSCPSFFCQKNCSNPYIILREVQQEPKFDSSLFDGVSRYGGRLRKLMTTVGSDFLRKFDLYIPPDCKNCVLYQKQMRMENTKISRERI
jgi:hypothetical protein